MSQGYTILPRFYDRWQNTYGEDFSNIVYPRLQATISRYRIPVSAAVDIGCGTGTLACMLAEQGWDMYGIDASQGMIAEAIAKVQAAGLSVQFSRQDMTEVHLPVSAGLVTAFFDVLNHLVERNDLLETIGRVYNLLRPGGLFVFDTSNERCYRILWSKTDIIRHEDFLLTLENSYDANTQCGESHVTVFHRVGDLYQRDEETVRQRFYSRRDVGSALRKQGFRVLEHRDFGFLNDPEMGKLKTWWVAQKPGTSN
ncbi:MAG: class I SAM-dependent methyltransferase [Ignavibacteria bacterium]|nr:class I SAM-dependent methyltransferase [Ignavibacteria bacterium]